MSDSDRRTGFQASDWVKVENQPVNAEKEVLMIIMLQHLQVSCAPHDEGSVLFGP